MKIQGNIVDIHNRNIFPGEITTKNQKIIRIETLPEHHFETYIIPGFIDAHIHIESAMLTPSEFAKAAVKQGTIASVCDPHEIANVLGEQGIEFMIENGKQSDFYFFFGVPANVPATQFEENGAILDIHSTKKLLARDDLYFLAEYMNYPSVITKEKEAIEKINYALSLNKPVDGHAPGLSGIQLRQYAATGISTDHETFNFDEALEKIDVGMKILIREGSAARNFDALIPLIETQPDKVMFCSDDKHPDELLQGHINVLVQKAVSMGYDVFDVLRAATINPAKHYNLPVGLLRVGDSADFLVVDSLKHFRIHDVFLKGKKVFPTNQKTLPSIIKKHVNNFRISPLTIEQFRCYPETKKIKVIDIIPDQLITKSFITNGTIVQQNVVSDITKDILKIAVINRYQQQNPAIGFIRGFGLKDGALATSVSHDSHNIIVIGTSDELICRAANKIIENLGGMIAISDNFLALLPLPIAGLMSRFSAEETANRYNIVKQIANSFGTALSDPFMTLSFMALLVIPELKMSNYGLFDVKKFNPTNLFVE